MRLIDADELKKNYTNTFAEKYGVKGAEMFRDIVNQMPTAYDPEKVADCLEKASTLYSLSERDCEFAIRQDLALHIVREGGAT